MKIPLSEIEAVEELPGRYSKIKVEQVLGMLKILERIQEEPALLVLPFVDSSTISRHMNHARQ